MKKAKSSSTPVIPEFIPAIPAILEESIINEMNTDPLSLLQAKKQMYIDLAQKLMNKIEVINHVAQTHIMYLTNRPIEDQIQKIMAAMKSIGNNITRAQAIQMLPQEQRLQLQPTATAATARVKGGVLKLAEINAAVIAYHCSWGRLPQSIKDSLEENDPKSANQTRYSQLQGYFNSILGRGDSYYKHLCSTGGLDLTQSVVHSDLPREIKDGKGNVIAIRPDNVATTQRFNESLALVRDAGLI